MNILANLKLEFEDWIRNPFSNAMSLYIRDFYSHFKKLFLFIFCNENSPIASLTLGSSVVLSFVGEDAVSLHWETQRTCSFPMHLPAQGVCLLKPKAVSSLTLELHWIFQDVVLKRFVVQLCHLVRESRNVECGCCWPWFCLLEPWLVNLSWNRA